MEVLGGVFLEVSGGTVLCLLYCARCSVLAAIGMSGARWPSLASLDEVGRLANSSEVKRDIIVGELLNPWGSLLCLNCFPDGELNAKKSWLEGSSSHDSKASYMSKALYMLCLSNKARFAGTDPVNKLSVRTLLFRTLESAQKWYSGIVLLNPGVHLGRSDQSRTSVCLQVEQWEEGSLSA